MEQIKMLDVKDLQKTLKIGRNSAYNLMQTEGFPSLQIGRKWLVSEEALREWLIDNEFNQININ